VARACSPTKLLVIDGPGAHNGYILYHNDYKAGWQAEEDLGSIGADIQLFLEQPRLKAQRLKGYRHQRASVTDRRAQAYPA
jgi:hypothetical protein